MLEFKLLIWVDMTELEILVPVPRLKFLKPYSISKLPVNELFPEFQVNVIELVVLLFVSIWYGLGHWELPVKPKRLKVININSFFIISTFIESSMLFKPEDFT